MGEGYFHKIVDTTLEDLLERLEVRGGGQRALAAVSPAAHRPGPCSVAHAFCFCTHTNCTSPPLLQFFVEDLDTVDGDVEYSVSCLSQLSGRAWHWGSKACTAGYHPHRPPPLACSKAC